MAIVEKPREFRFTVDDFNFLRKLSNQHSGIQVPDERFDMFYSRLSKRVRKLGLNDFKEYCQYLKDYPEHEFTEFINSITTNLTAFFREIHHFDYLRDVVIPEVLKRNKNTKQIRVWSAGCSTGEEPYTLAMTLLDNVPPDWDIKILATDLDTNVLQTAMDGVYSEERVTDLSEQVLKRWFMRGTGAQGGLVRVRPQLQKIIQFKKLNLMQDWPMKCQFDFIFCRNVLIYFDRDTKALLASKYAKMLASRSWLFIGHSESLNQLSNEFDLVATTTYKKNI
ncbi:MAG: protein-glutamate O-methyltransferase [Methylococcaceae bacterium]|nr:protein-glutamate O-methyltransferase [Methylococcaceae bacterium]MDZ4155523.1 protein-glutamate O-methyltransferase [Methylococcales bacterium]MDP2395247.1 protein-glutamate O-methyltransferase [Methylococcaceae bacterium]MDP3020641.1 protein-glutamate O-methyltransferase [Methylococcaceae bacterium]MDP3390080.1 protein-glutamate O-methyltransferase [Methylococcaceae bacterium]